MKLVQTIVQRVTGLLTSLAYLSDGTPTIVLANSTV